MVRCWQVSIKDCKLDKLEISTIDYVHSHKRRRQKCDLFDAILLASLKCLFSNFGFIYSIGNISSIVNNFDFNILVCSFVSSWSCSYK